MSLRSLVTTPKSSMIQPERIARRQSKRGLIYSVFALAAFSVVFTLVRTKRSQPTDTAITLEVQKKDHPVFDRLMRVVSWPGFPPQSRLLPPGIAAALWLRGMRLEAILQLAAWGTGGVSTVFKRIMQRPRPTSDGTDIRVVVANIGGSSFPSGHVIIYTGVYGFAAFLAQTWIRPAAIRRAVVGLLGGMLSLVGLSRIYLGHHWFTDVVASYLLGSTYLLGLIAAYRRMKRWTLRA